MGLKYSINSAGRIVAERDIYSLGGFIPKGRLGGAIKDETQLSQEGECWFNSGDITGRPDIVIKDNAYLGEFTPGTSEVRTDGITELSGNTLIPGILCWRTQKTYPLCNTFIKDSFIGVTMDVACGPEASTKAFPFGQGLYRVQAPAGTLFANMVVTPIPQNSCRGFANLRIGRGIKLYIPTGMRAQVLWGYFNEANQATYSGTYTEYNAGLAEVNNPVYKIGQIHIWKVDGTAMTPAQLEESGAKILGHVSGSVRSYCNGISASGNYTLDNCNVYWNTDDFAFATDRHAMFAGHAYNCDISLLASADVSVCGMFRNIERLEIGRRMLPADYQNVKRDSAITASDCPLLRLNAGYVFDDLWSRGDLVLRRCVVPKAAFPVDKVDGNTYEDIDFSYTNEFMGTKVSDRTYVCSHKQGLYTLYSASGSLTGRASYPDNTKDAAGLTEAHDIIPLNGDLIEQGAYGGGSQIPYESAKTDSPIRVRTGRPIRTPGLRFPSLPEGYSVKALYYLDEDLVIRSTVTDPSGITETYPYVVMLFRKNDDTKITASEFIALNVFLTQSDYTKVPEITGSAYVGAGCVVRGDVQLHGDPYVNRVFDVNMWERGEMALEKGVYWEDAKADIRLHARFRLKQPIPVSNGDTFTAEAGYNIWCVGLDADKNVVADSGSWVQTDSIKSDRVKYEIIVVRKGADALIEDSDIPLANVKCVRRFKERRYITNELDRKSPEDILIGPDYWEQGTAGGGQADAGKTYEELKATSGTTIRLKRPINVSPSSSISSASGFSRYIRVLDAATKFHLGESLNSAKMALLAAIIQKDPSAAITPSEIANSRLVLEFVPQPRIITPYGVSNLWIEGTKVRMYDNSVLSRTITQGQEVTLKGDAVMRSVFTGDVCICSNGHDDAIINKP